METSQLSNAGVMIERLAESLTSAKALSKVGASVSETAKQSARAKGGRRFWAEVARSVSYQKMAGADAVQVGATHVAAAQKQFGGVISAPGRGEGATGAKWLTIPVGVARERRLSARKASETYSLFLVKSKAGKRLLFGTKKAKKRNKISELLFVLKKSVTQKADPWFPEGATLQSAISRGIENYLKSLQS